MTRGDIGLKTRQSTLLQWQWWQRHKALVWRHKGSSFVLLARMRGRIWARAWIRRALELANQDKGIPSDALRDNVCDNVCRCLGDGLPPSVYLFSTAEWNVTGFHMIWHQRFRSPSRLHLAALTTNLSAGIGLEFAWFVMLMGWIYAILPLTSFRSVACVAVTVF